MSKFWDLLRESVILQALIALILVGVICYLYIVGKDVPEALTQALFVILGFYFGAKSAEYLRR